MSPILHSAEYRIRPKVMVNNDLFDQDPPTWIHCTVLERLIDSEDIERVWRYELRKITGGPPGTHTTYRPVKYQWDQNDWLGKEGHEPILLTGQDPPIKYVYNVVISKEELAIYAIPPTPHIAWAKTVNAIKQPEDWWRRTEQGLIIFQDHTPPEYADVFNNFPHPQGPIDGVYWPGDPTDHCHWDWLKRSLWPQELHEAVCADMLLEMLIDDWGTWGELYEEDILTVPRWVL
jgi:hypothetical protein